MTVRPLRDASRVTHELSQKTEYKLATWSHFSQSLSSGNQRIISQHYYSDSISTPTNLIDMSSSQSSLSSHRSAHVATDTSSNPAVYSFEKNVRNPEQLQYTLGKTIGSGTYAKVKAAWSPYEKKLVSPFLLSQYYVLTSG